MDRNKYKKLKEYKEFKYVGFCLIFSSALALLQVDNLEYFFTHMNFFQKIALTFFIGSILLQLFKWIKSEMDTKVHFIIFTLILVALLCLNVIAIFLVNIFIVTFLAFIFDLVFVQIFLAIMLEKIVTFWYNFLDSTKDKTEVLSTAIAILAAVVSLIAFFK